MVGPSRIGHPNGGIRIGFFDKFSCDPQCTGATRSVGCGGTAFEQYFVRTKCQLFDMGIKA